MAIQLNKDPRRRLIKELILLLKDRTEIKGITQDTTTRDEGTSVILIPYSANSGIDHSEKQVRNFRMQVRIESYEEGRIYDTAETIYRNITLANGDDVQQYFTDYFVRITPTDSPDFIIADEDRMWTTFNCDVTFRILEEI